jgi:hypothetical protein
MRSRLHLWRRRLWLWLPALAFFVVNFALLSAYRLVYVGQGRLLEERLTARQEELAAAEAVQQDLEATLLRAERNRQEIATFYRRRLATEGERLTQVIAEVKDLARRAALEPSALSYPTESLQEFGLRKRSIVFGVEGTYAELRKLVNLLELSDSFLQLEEIQLDDAGAGGNDPRLRINLRISTLFLTGEVPTAPREERRERPERRGA